MPDLDVIGQALPLLLRGLVTTVQITLVSAAIALVLSFVLGLALLSGNHLVRGAARTWVEIFRGTSALIQLFYFYFVLPGLLGITISPFVAAVAALSINTGAYGSEIVRSAIRAVPPGQREAAIALNLSPARTLRAIILPQALSRMLPPFGNQLVELLKVTSLVSLITVADLSFQAQSFVQGSGHTTLIYSLTLVLYFVACYPLSRLSRSLELSLQRKGRA